MSDTMCMMFSLRTSHSRDAQHTFILTNEARQNFFSVFAKYILKIRIARICLIELEYTKLYLKCSRRSNGEMLQNIPPCYYGRTTELSQRC